MRLPDDIAERARPQLFGERRVRRGPDYCLTAKQIRHAKR
jgi:hypothetical protein